MGLYLFVRLNCVQRGPSTRPPQQDTMQMLCTRNDDVIVAVFFDVKTCVTTSTENQNYVRDFLHQVSYCSNHRRGRTQKRDTKSLAHMLKTSCTNKLRYICALSYCFSSGCGLDTRGSRQVMFKCILHPIAVWWSRHLCHKF